MAIFTEKDVTANFTTQTDGTQAFIGTTLADVLNDQNDPDTYQVLATSTSNVAILTGMGNDNIDVTGVSGISFIDAGAGSNTITAGTGIANFVMDSSSPGATDTIFGFHAGDSLMFDNLTASMEFVRGKNVVITAWNPQIPGSAVYVTLVNATPSMVSATHTGGNVIF